MLQFFTGYNARVQPLFSRSSETGSDLALLRGAAKKIKGYKQVMPQLKASQLKQIADDVAANKPLNKQQRLTIALLKLSALHEARKGEEMMQQIYDVFHEVETTYVDKQWVHQWGKGTAEAFVKETFDKYLSQWNTGGIYTKPMKPPHERFNMLDIFEGKSIYKQLSHFVIIDRNTGAIEIQEMDRKEMTPQQQKTMYPTQVVPRRRAYCQALPDKRHLVIFQKKGKGGKSVWDTAQWNEDAWHKRGQYNYRKNLHRAWKAVQRKNVMSPILPTSKRAVSFGATLQGYFLKKA